MNVTENFADRCLEVGPKGYTARRAFVVSPVKGRLASPTIPRIGDAHPQFNMPATLRIRSREGPWLKVIVLYGKLARKRFTATAIGPDCFLLSYEFDSFSYNEPAWDTDFGRVQSRLSRRWNRIGSEANDTIPQMDGRV